MSAGTSQIIGALKAQAGSFLNLDNGTLTIAHDNDVSTNPNANVSTAQANTLIGAGQLNLEDGRFDVTGANRNLQANVNIAVPAIANLNDAVGLGNDGTATVMGALSFNGAAGDLRKTMAGAGAINLNSAANISIAATASNDGFAGTWNLAPGTVLRVGPPAAGANALGDAGTVFGSGSTVNVAQSALFNIAGVDQTIKTLNNTGTVQIANASASAAPAMLMVSGNYTGGGTVILNTQFAGDDSLTDMLTIGGNATGSTLLELHQRPGSTGAQTINGIKLVDVLDGSTSAPGAFTLAGGTIAVDAYVYELEEKDEDWYLVSLFEEPGGSENPEPPDWSRPEVGSYLDNRYVALASQFHTLHDRQGHAPGLPRQPGSAYASDPDANSWVRVQGNFGSRKSANFKNTDDTYLLHLGSDVARWHVGEQGSMRLGVMALAMHSQGRSTAPGDLGSSSHSVNGVNGGVYATWYGNRDMLTGPYADVWALYGSFDNTVRGRDKEKYSSRALSASLELGYGFQVHEKKEAGRTQRVIVQPQAQVVVSSYRAGDHTEGAQTLNTVVSKFKHSEVTTRLGVRVYTDDQPDGASDKNFERSVRPFAEANWLHGKSSHQIAMGSQIVREKLPADRAEFKLGVEGKLSRTLTAWAFAGAQTTFSKRYNSVSVNAGLKYSW
jgi:outer membrane autotransporter protein